MDFQVDRALAKTELSLLAGALNMRRPQLRDAIRSGRRFQCFLNPEHFIFPKDESEAPIFLAIEMEMVNISGRSLIESLLEIDDYPSAILQSAVERIAGNKLAQIDNDHEFDTKLLELESVYLRCYYRVAYRYKLPTIRILPFIFRLITL